MLSKLAYITSGTFVGPVVNNETGGGVRTRNYRTFLTKSCFAPTYVARVIILWCNQRIQDSILAFYQTTTSPLPSQCCSKLACITCSTFVDPIFNNEMWKRRELFNFLEKKTALFQHLWPGLPPQPLRSDESSWSYAKLTN